MPPEIGLAILPVIDASHEGGTIKRLRELHEPPEQRLAGDLLRKGLQNPDAGIFFHDARHRDHECAGHEAVRVKDYHVAVALAPAAAEVGDVAAFAIDGLLAMAVEDFSEGTELSAEFQPRGLLFDPFVRLVAVAEDKEVEVREVAGLFQRLVGHTQAFPHAGDVLVVNGNDDGDVGTDRLGGTHALNRLPKVGGIVSRAVLLPYTDQRGPESGVQLVEERDEAEQQADLRPAEASAPHVADQQPTAEQGAEAGEGEEGHTARTS